jgi:hypothetical protein
MIVNGKSVIDVLDWKGNTIYSEPFCKSHQVNFIFIKVIQWFWEVLQTLSQDKLSKFLQFCTGSATIPITGFR